MLADDILNYLERITREFNPDELDFEAYAAISMAERFQVKRNTVSHYLNQAAEEGRVIKINTRPVLFLHRQAFEDTFFAVQGNSYRSLEELWKEKKEKNAFSGMIGYDGSMKEALRQIKTSAYYPGNGLPIMLCGPTGAGKSFLARLTYQYLVDEGVLEKDAPFVVFNCAQYFNNPELLSSNLFGYVKGAFTGADKNMPGMLEEADGGVLFLDEVHRLNEESQEKLFTFMDQGIFRRMGESSGNHRASVRLIFATTEKLTENFLHTFLRRIPIVVSIPGLAERSKKEKKQYIYYFLSRESRVFQKPVKISDNILDIFCDYPYEANVGELQNLLKFTVARAYSRQREEAAITVKLFDLPEKMLQNPGEQRERKIHKRQIITITDATAVPETGEEKKDQEEDVSGIYRQMILYYQQLLENLISCEEFYTAQIRTVFHLLDHLMFRQRDRYSEVMVQYVTGNLQEIFNYLEYTYQLSFNGNSLYTITYFLLLREDLKYHWTKEEKALWEGLHRFVTEQMGTEYELMRRMVSLIENKVDVTFSREDEIFLTFYMKSMAADAGQKRMKAVILAHGYATASSLANTANRILGMNLYEAFDMPMDVEAREVTARLISYLKQNDVSRGMLILVDMGSLADIYEKIRPYLQGPTGIFDNVSTKMAIFAGDLIREGKSVEEIEEELKTHMQTTYKIAYPRKEREKAIVASCMTGMGTALRLQQLLRDSIPEEAGIRILAHDYVRLKMNGLQDPALQDYQVLLVVGTMDPHLENVPFISLEQLIMGKQDNGFRRTLSRCVDENLLDRINDNLVHCFSMRRVIGTLTILDTEKVLRTVEAGMRELEKRVGTEMSNNKKIALQVHICCMAERLIRRDALEQYPGLKELEQCQGYLLRQIKESFSVMEKEYSVNIPPEELGYIYDIFAAPEAEEEDF